MRSSEGTAGFIRRGNRVPAGPCETGRAGPSPTRARESSGLGGIAKRSLTVLALLAPLALAVVPAPAAQAAAPAFNYGEALQKSIWFYEAQQSGDAAELEPRRLARRLRRSTTATTSGWT